MQTTSALWKSLWASGNAWMEAVAVIAGTTYTEITAPVINRAVMQTGLTVGNAVSATCGFTVRTEATIPKSAEVQIQMRLTDGTQTSEWLPAGTFYISRRQRDPVSGLLTLECYDALLKANAEYEPTGSWPRSMEGIVEEIAQTLGVEIDERTVIQTGDDYVVPLPDTGTTINAILCGIAAVHGGNWIITPENELRLVQVISAAGAEDAQTFIDVLGVIGGIKVETARSVTGIRVVGNDGDTIIGNENGLVVDINSPYSNQANAEALAAVMIGQTYQPFTLTQAVYDPAAEIGDYIQAGADGEVMSVLYGEVAKLGIAFRGDLTALEVSEMADEYPYIGKSDAMAAQIRRLTVVVADKASVEELDAMNARLDNLSVSDIKAGIIHSADYAVVIIPKIYPASTLFPAISLYPNNGERVTSGFAIDFETGQIYGGFYSEQIATLQTSVTELQSAVTVLQNALVYPKAVPSRMATMAFAPLGARKNAIVTDNLDKEEEE